MSETRLSLRIDLANGSRLGPGKVKLLESVKRCASISAAAREQGMSYRRAWLLIDDMNRAFQEPVVETFPGRSQGKGAHVTEMGERLISLYRSAEEQCATAIAQQAVEIEARANANYDAKRIKTDRDPPDAEGA
ncbi:MAG: winged helix-turn-helix domain-containing protein [Pseudomonadota bacterium]